jgi:hypothetical protein
LNLIGKWIVCKRDGGEHDPRTATPVRIACVTGESGYARFNKELAYGKAEYVYFESYALYFEKRNINLAALPIRAY